jgi:hypothetical protein
MYSTESIALAKELSKISDTDRKSICILLGKMCEPSKYSGSDFDLQQMLGSALYEPMKKADLE